MLTNYSLAQNTAKPLSNSENELIGYLFGDCKPNQPGVSVLVVKKGEIIYEANYGLADVEKNIKITSSSNFRIASVTKQFTALAIMILIEKEKLSYDTKLTEIFTDFPEYGNKITVRHLLTHQSGLVDYNRFIEEDREEQLLDSDVLTYLKETHSSHFEPGSEYRYSNTGYAVLSQIVEKVSGMSFAKFMKKEVFHKLKMYNTTVFEANKKIEKRAYGYAVENDSIIPNDQSISSAIQGDGGIYCSINDYYKWDQALYSNKLVPKNILDDAFTDWDNHTKTKKDGEGYGWFIEYQNGIKILHHSGGTAGFESQVIRIPSIELTVVLFSNRNWTGRNLRYKVRALTSIFSNGKIPMPIEIVLKKEIEHNGVAKGLELYSSLKGDNNYKTSKPELYYLGIIYLNQNQNKEAEGIFNLLTKDFAKYANGFYGLGIVHKRIGKPDEAIKNFNKAIELSDDKNSRIVNRSKKYIEELTDKN